MAARCWGRSPSSASASNDATAFAYDAKAQVEGYVDLVTATYSAAFDAATTLRVAIGALTDSPSAEARSKARAPRGLRRAVPYLDTEAFLFYAGPVDGPGGPFPRLNGWPVDPAGLDALIADEAQSLILRHCPAQHDRAAGQDHHWPACARISAVGRRWRADGRRVRRAAPRRGQYAEALAQLLVNDLTVVSAAWAAGENNYRAVGRSRWTSAMRSAAPSTA